MRIGGELSDPALTQPELFTCGYTTGGIQYAEIDDGAVVGGAADIGSGLSAYCLQLPDGTAAGASFTVTTGTAVPRRQREVHHQGGHDDVPLTSRPRSDLDAPADRP